VTIAPLPPPPPPPATLPEFVERYLTAMRVDGRRWEKAERFTAELVTAADGGTESPSPDGLDPESLYVVGDMLSELFAQTRMFPPSHPLILRVLREWNRRVETVPPQAPPPGQHWRPRPTARLRPRLGPVFRPSRTQMAVAPAVLARQLQDLAASGEAAARFLRELATAVSDGSGMAGEDAGADATPLGDAGREAVGALLEAGTRAMRARGKSDLAAGLSQVFGEWQVWARTPQPGSNAGSGNADARRQR
jgi:hypothetical protein